jgi:hypothetical protein
MYYMLNILWNTILKTAFLLVAYCIRVIFLVKILIRQERMLQSSFNWYTISLDII